MTKKINEQKNLNWINNIDFNVQGLAKCLQYNKDKDLWEVGIAQILVFLAKSQMEISQNLAGIIQAINDLNYNVIEMLKDK